MSFRFSAINLLVFALLGAVPASAGDCPSQSSKASKPAACTGHSEARDVTVHSAPETDAHRQVASLPGPSERFAASGGTSGKFISAADNSAENEATKEADEEIDIEYVFGPEDFKPVTRSSSDCSECSLQGHTNGHAGHRDYARARRLPQPHVSVPGPVAAVVHIPVGVIRGGGSVVVGTVGGTVHVAAGVAQVPGHAVKGAAGVAASAIETAGDIVSWAITMPFELID